MVLYGGDLAVGAYGIVNRLVFLFVMIVIGLNQGMQPIAGYNFGARHYDRLIQVLKYSIAGATAVMITGFVVGMFFSYECARAFTTDPDLIDKAGRGMRLVVMCFPLVGMQIVTTSFFQSIGHAGKSIFLSLTRQLLFLVPLLLILPTWWGIKGVWMSMPVADGLASILAFTLLVKQMRKFKQANQSTSTPV
jgi:Na+-driven multidrug efflux pump